VCAHKLFPESSENLSLQTGQITYGWHSLASAKQSYHCGLQLPPYSLPISRENLTIFMHVCVPWIPRTPFSSSCTQLGSWLYQISAKYCMIPICVHNYRSKYSIHLVWEKQCLYLQVVVHCEYIDHILTPFTQVYHHWQLSCHQTWYSCSRKRMR